MKKLLCCLLVLLLISLCGCSLMPGIILNNDIETLKGWSFQCNSGTNDYSLFFGLLNSNDTYISADVDVDISYKLYDGSGYLVDSGNIYLQSLSKGDKFKDDSINFYDAVPGETYNIVLAEYSW